jgi:phage terminase large subunit-like protein
MRRISGAQLADVHRVVEAAPLIDSYLATHRFRDYYPDTGPLRRELYPKHTAFFAAGATNRERGFMAGNRVGKTEGVGAFEVTSHLTGQYPDWWTGRRFSHPVRAWAAGDSSKTVREIIQQKLLGEFLKPGTGMIPGDCIVHTTPKSGVPQGIDMVWVRHVCGENSKLVLKSYEQGAKSFQGTEQDLVWLDEEPPMDVYAECLVRTMTTNGLVIATFTPLLGLSAVVLSFLPEGDLANPAKFTLFCEWDEVPHLDDVAKAELEKSIPPYQRQARMKGVPVLGSGAIYPVPEEDIVEDDFSLPDHWARGYGLDVGWNRTAAIWSAWDRQSDTLHLYSEHYRGEAEPAVHAAAIRARGPWICGAIDPSARGRSATDGQNLFQMYSDLGLSLVAADRSVETGIFRLWQRLSTQRLRVFRSCVNWLTEYRLYRRDEQGRIVKERDHLMDATRYLEMELPTVAKLAPAKRASAPKFTHRAVDGTGWMG